jgi:hypothetical protein
MTAMEKANAGVWLLRQAALDLLKAGAMQPHEVEEALKIPGMGMGLLGLMADKGEVEKGTGRHPRYSLPRQANPQP